MYAGDMSMATALIALQMAASFPEWLQGVGALAITDEDDRAAFQVQHHREVAVPLADRDLVDGQQTQVPQLRLGEMLFQMALLDVFVVSQPTPR